MKPASSASEKTTALRQRTSLLPVGRRVPTRVRTLTVMPGIVLMRSCPVVVLVLVVAALAVACGFVADTFTVAAAAEPGGINAIGRGGDGAVDFLGAPALATAETFMLLLDARKVSG